MDENKDEDAKAIREQMVKMYAEKLEKLTNEQVITGWQLHVAQCNHDEANKAAFSAK